MKKFTLILNYCVELDNKVIDQVDDDWRSTYYDLHTDEEIAEHVGQCLVKGNNLSDIDGWADLPNADSLVTVTQDAVVIFCK